MPLLPAIEQFSTAPSQLQFLQALEQLLNHVSPFEGEISSLASLGVVGYATRAGLEVDLAHPANTIAYVTADPTSANNTVYLKLGASGAGSWSMSTGAYALASVLDQRIQSQQSAQDFAIADPAGRIYARILNGLLEFSSISVQSLDAASANVQNMSISGREWNQSHNHVALKPRLGASYNHIIGYGQSLMAGVNGGAIVSTTQRFDSLMFSGGVRPLDNTADPLVAYAALVPLIEQTGGANSLNAYANNGTNLWETPLAGCCEAIKERLQSENGLSPADSFYKFIASDNAMSGYNISALIKGTTPYARILSEASYAKALTAADNRDYAVTGIIYQNGEYESVTLTYTYFFEQLYHDLNADIKSITGQVDDIVFFTYQTPARFDIGLQQLYAVEHTAGMHMACPIYQFTFADANHLVAVDNKKFGAQMGKAMKRVTVDGIDWKPLSPASHRIVGNSIYIKMNMLGQKLVIDTTQTPAQTDYGFRVEDAGAAVQTINAITIESNDTIRLTCAVTPITGWLVKYAIDINGGNIRDNDGDADVFDPTGINYPLHNWLVAFQMTV